MTIRSTRWPVAGWPVLLGALALCSLALGVEPPAGESEKAPTAPMLEAGAEAHAEDGAEPGRLLIVGGGLRGDNDLVYGRLFELLASDCKVCIIPTASARPSESAASAKSSLSRYAPEDTTIHIIELTTDDPARADDAGVAKELRTCDALWFTGGDQSRITRVFRPRGRETVALGVVQELLAGGGVIAGSSAGAAMMSDPMISGGSSRNWVRRAWPIEEADGGDGGDEGEVVAAERLRMGHGLGFFPYGIIDQHFLARGRLGRLVLALEAAEIERGYGIADNRALAVDLATHTIEALGAGAAIVLDISGMERWEGWRNVRLSIISTGDKVDGLTGEITPASGVVARKGEVVEDGKGDGELDPWSRDAVLKLLGRLAADPVTPAVAANEEVELHLSADERTQFFGRLDDGDDGGLRAVDVRLDLIVR